MMISGMDSDFTNILMETYMKELLIKERNKDLVSKNSVMAICIEDNIKMINLMVRDNMNGKIPLDMRVSLNRVEEMVKEFGSHQTILMLKFIKANIFMIKKMDMEFTDGTMALIIKGILNKTKSMELEKLVTKMEKLQYLNGLMGQV